MRALREGSSVVTDSERPYEPEFGWRELVAALVMFGVERVRACLTTVYERTTERVSALARGEQRRDVITHDDLDAEARVAEWEERQRANRK